MNSTNHALHVYYALRDQQAFQKLLGASKHEHSQFSRSSHRAPQSIVYKADVNARDAQGRTVLHLACSNPSHSSLEYVKLLLTRPDIDLDLQDQESHWTALHRAAYAGNIATCVFLLKRGADPSVPDFEGLFALDVYNLTIPSGHPDASDTFSRKQLFTWGTNRNGVLCHADGADRPFPEQVPVRNEASYLSSSVMERFGTRDFLSIAMAKLHSVVLTSESTNNLRICGFGSGGRLGALTNTQYKLAPLSSALPMIKSVALGQDHTLALTEDGVIYSWGLNRFSQLGYTIDTLKSGAEPIQAVPRKIQGALKKEVALGIAACKTASACWTSHGQLFTWGTNHGQLGYDSLAHPTQVFPRVVSSIDFRVVGVALADSTMACLSSNGDVICFSGNAHFKIPFGSPHTSLTFQRQSRTLIQKVINSDDIFAFLTHVGDVLTIDATELVKDGDRPNLVRPRRIWNRSHESSSAQDIALAGDGALILCSKGGHIYVQAKQVRLVGRGSKFQRVPYIHRAFSICANAGGSFGTLKHEFLPGPVIKKNRRVGDDFWQLLQAVVPEAPNNATVVPEVGEEDTEDIEDQNAVRQRFISQQCLLALEPLSKSPSCIRLSFNPSSSRDSILVECGKLQVVAHRSLLLARCPSLETFPIGSSEGLVTVVSHLHGQSCPRVVFTECNSLSVLLLLIYAYTDEVVAIWDRRVSSTLQLSTTSINTHRIHKEMQDLAHLLHLTELKAAVSLASIHLPRPTLSLDMRRLYEFLCCGHDTPPPLCDVKLAFEDRVLFCSSCILQARSPYFAAFFGDSVWTASRRNAEGFVDVELPYIRWLSAKVAFAHIYYGAQEELFDIVEHVTTLDELIDFLFEVLDVANELLLEDLKVACTNVIIRFVDMHNLAAILAEAAHLGVDILLDKLYHYIAMNLESLLTYSILEDIPQGLLTRVGEGIQKLQIDYAPFIRRGGGLYQIMQHNESWLELQDFPRPILPCSGITRVKSPKTGSSFSFALPTEAGKVVATPEGAGNGSICEEDGSEKDVPTTPLKGTAWKAHSPSISSKASLRSIMMEAERISIRDSTISSPSRGKETNLNASAQLSMQGGKEIGLRSQLIRGGQASYFNSAEGHEDAVGKTSGTPHVQMMFPKVGTPSPSERLRRAAVRPAWKQQSSSSGSTGSGTGINATFAEIQSEQQRDRGFLSQKEKLSLKEIQQEEEAHQQEEEFLRWWAAEEEKVQNENRALEILTIQSMERGGRGKGRGRGRGERSRGRQRGRESGR